MGARRPTHRPVIPPSAAGDAAPAGHEAAPSGVSFLWSGSDAAVSGEPPRRGGKGRQGMGDVFAAMLDPSP